MIAIFSLTKKEKEKGKDSGLDVARRHWTLRESGRGAFIQEEMKKRNKYRIFLTNPERTRLKKNWYISVSEDWINGE